MTERGPIGPTPSGVGLRLLAFGSLVLVPGCGSGRSGIEGKYYNTRSGEFAMELKGGQVLSIQGLADATLTYTVRGDSVIIDDASTPEPVDLVLTIGKKGTLDAGPLGSLTRK